MGTLPPHLRFDRFLDRRAHLGVTGSVAAFRSLDVLRLLRGAGLEVGVTLTRSARQFVAPLAFQALGADPVDSDMFPAEEPFAHLAPGRTAHAMVIAPATANFLAKMAHGLADDMLSCQVLSFDGPVVAAPAMNPRLWNAAATRENWDKLLSRGVIGLAPETGSVACGDEGRGRLVPPETILMAALRAVAPQDLAGRQVLVSLGPTREFWDPVRFLSNPSSGTMGGAIAVAAWLRGAEVTAVCGPVDIYFPCPGPGFRRIDVVTAREMLEACGDLWPSMDFGCLTAAVSDFSPQPFGDRKFKKDRDLDGAEAPTLPLVLNPDVLAALGAVKRPDQRLIGFAAETGDLEENAKAKLGRKNLDLIVANRVDLPDQGFAVPTNAAYVLDRTGRQESWPVLPKTEIAWRIWDRVLEL